MWRCDRDLARVAGLRHRHVLLLCLVTISSTITAPTAPRARSAAVEIAAKLATDACSHYTKQASCLHTPDENCAWDGEKTECYVDYVVHYGKSLSPVLYQSDVTDVTVTAVEGAHAERARDLLNQGFTGAGLNQVSQNGEVTLAERARDPVTLALRARDLLKKGIHSIIVTGRDPRHVSRDRTYLVTESEDLTAACLRAGATNQGIRGFGGVDDPNAVRYCV